MSKKEWESRVVLLLHKLKDQYHIEDSEVEILLNSYLEIIHKRQVKKNSRERRIAITKIEGKEKIAINKADKDKVKQLLNEVLDIL